MLARAVAWPFRGRDAVDMGIVMWVCDESFVPGGSRKAADGGNRAAAGILAGPATVSGRHALILPATFFGAVCYPWAELGGVLWLKILDLAKPLVYINEALRAVPAASVPHTALSAPWCAMAALTIVLVTVGIRGFCRRTTS